MKWTKNWGTVSGSAELYMLNHAEHTHQAIVKNGGNYMPRYRRCRYPGCHAMVQLPDHYCATHYDHEAEYLASRQRWARKHAEQYRHHDRRYAKRYNSVTRNRNEDRSDQYKFYQSKQWVDLRQSVLDRDHYLCQYCQAFGKLTPNSKTVDHIVPIAYDSGIEADISNLATICRDCHRLKTQWEQSYYGTGQNMAKKDVPEIHDIHRIAILMHRHR